MKGIVHYCTMVLYVISDTIKVQSASHECTISSAPPMQFDVISDKSTMLDQDHICQLWCEVQSFFSKAIIAPSAQYPFLTIMTALEKFYMTSYDWLIRSKMLSCNSVAKIVLPDHTYEMQHFHYHIFLLSLLHTSKKSATLTSHVYLKVEELWSIASNSSMRFTHNLQM